MNDTRADAHSPSRIGKNIRRLMRRTYTVIGAVANVLGVYAFGESHGWWRLPVVISPEAEQQFWMLVVGVGGPWAMIIGAWIAFKVTVRNAYDVRSTMQLIKPIIDIGFFFALLHCAQMSFGLIIFSRYLNATGFAMVFSIYLAIGLGFGLLIALLDNRRSHKYSSEIE